MTGDLRFIWKMQLVSIVCSWFILQSASSRQEVLREREDSESQINLSFFYGKYKNKLALFSSEASKKSKI